MRINCPTGMSALMRKHLLEESGGIGAFASYLAEDFFFAKSFTDRFVQMFCLLLIELPCTFLDVVVCV